MQKRSRVSIVSGSAAKRARLQHSRHGVKLDYPLFARTSGLNPESWKKLIDSADGFLQMPVQFDRLLTEDESIEDNAFQEYAAQRLSTGLINEEHAVQVRREWYCCKLFIFRSLDQLRLELKQLIIAITAAKPDPGELLDRALTIEENLWHDSTQYLYGFAVGQLFESYCREQNFPIMQPFLCLFLTNRLTEFLWPPLERMFQWDYIDTSVMGFSADDSTESRDYNLSSDELAQYNTEELLWNNIRVPPDLARHLIKRTILDRAESYRQNQIDFIEFKAKQAPICEDDQPLLYVEHPSIISLLGDNVLICSGTDPKNSRVEMHRALVKAVKGEDTRSLDVAHSWATAPTLAIDLTEICMNPKSIRSSRYNQDELIAGGFARLDVAEFLDEDLPPADPSADLINRIATTASTIFRVYMLLKKLNKGPLI